MLDHVEEKHGVEARITEREAPGEVDGEQAKVAAGGAARRVGGHPRATRS